ncbi:MAG: nucleotidyltransferase domain-containing protein [bacterium]
MIFGSYATGKFHQWSDIDVIVISPQFDKVFQRKDIDIDLLWRTTARTDNRIEPIPCGEQQWEKDDSTPIIEIARREGVLVELCEVAGTNSNK